MSVFNGTIIDAIPRISCNQEQAAAALGIEPQTLRQWEREGRITSSKPGGKVRLYLVEDLKRLARTGTAKAAE